MLHEYVNGLCVTCPAERGFDPAEHRDPHSGKWSAAGAVIAKAEKKLAGGKLQLHAHESGAVTVHDEHGGALHLADDKEIAGFGRSVRQAGDLAKGKTRERQLFTEKNGKGHLVSTHGFRKTHVEPSSADAEDDPYYKDRATLHLPVGGEHVENPDELYKHPGTEATTAELQELHDAIGHMSSARRIDTGHGRVDVHQIGADYTIAPVGKKPIVLDRAGAKAVNRALEDAANAYDTDQHAPLGAGDTFQRTVSTNAGDIHIARQGEHGSWWIETDTDAIQLDDSKAKDFLDTFGAPFEGPAETHGLKPIH